MRTQLTSELIGRAVGWWRSKKPNAYTMEDHLANPTVNCTTPLEKALARSAARVVQNIQDEVRSAKRR